MNLWPVASALCLSLALGCSDGRDHAAEMATATCRSGLQEALHLQATDPPPSLKGVHVATTATGRRVEGMFTNGGAPPRSFACEVTPDAADSLRGLRVTRLDLSPS